MESNRIDQMVRHYQPDVIIDNRLEGAGDNHGSIATDNPLIYSGDLQVRNRSFRQKEYVISMESQFHGNFAQQ